VSASGFFTAALRARHMLIPRPITQVGKPDQASDWGDWLGGATGRVWVTRFDHLSALLLACLAKVAGSLHHRGGALS